MSMIDSRPIRSLIGAGRRLAVQAHNAHAQSHSVHVSAPSPTPTPPPPPPIWDTFVYNPHTPTPTPRHHASSLATSSRVTLDHFQTILNLQYPPYPARSDLASTDPLSASAAHALGITSGGDAVLSGLASMSAGSGEFGFEQMRSHPPMGSMGMGVRTGTGTGMGDWSGAGKALEFATDEELVHSLLLSGGSRQRDQGKGKSKGSGMGMGVGVGMDRELSTSNTSKDLHDWHLTLDPSLAYLALRSRPSYTSFLATARPFVRTLYPKLVAGGAHQLFVSDLLLRHPDHRTLAQILELNVKATDKLRDNLICSIYSVLYPDTQSHSHSHSQASPFSSQYNPHRLSAQANLVICRAMSRTSTWSGLERAWMDLHDTLPYNPESNYILLSHVLDLLPHRSDRAMALFSILVTAIAPNERSHWGDEDDDGLRRLPSGVLKRGDPAHPRASEILVRGAMVRACLRWKLYQRAQREMEGLMRVGGRCGVNEEVLGAEDNPAMSDTCELLWEVCRGSVASMDETNMDWAMRQLQRLISRRGRTSSTYSEAIPGNLIDAFIQARIDMYDSHRERILELYDSIPPYSRTLLSPTTLLRVAQYGPPVEVMLMLAQELELHPIEQRTSVVAPFMRALLAAVKSEDMPSRAEGYVQEDGTQDTPSDPSVSTNHADEANANVTTNTNYDSTLSTVSAESAESDLPTDSPQSTSPPDVSPCTSAALSLFLSSRAILSPSDLAHITRFLRPHKHLARLVLQAQERRLLFPIRAQGRRSERDSSIAVNPYARLALAEGWLLFNDMGSARRQLADIRVPVVTLVGARGGREGEGAASASESEMMERNSSDDALGRRTGRGRRNRKRNGIVTLEDKAEFERGLQKEVDRVLSRSPEVGKALEKALVGLGLGWAISV